MYHYGDSLKEAYKKFSNQSEYAPVVRGQLKGWAANKKDWNRNVFTVRTNDDISSLIREYCNKNNISKNHFLMNLLKDFFKYGSI